MTYEHSSTGTVESSPQSDCCQCEHDLPATPYTALRVAYGMLLSEDDFRVLMANPRGKQMLTAAWLHGPGVVWGYQVRREGTDKLTVSPGLAVDGIGRLCAQDSTSCVDLSEWVKENVERSDGDCGTETIRACLTVEFSCCRTHPVPTLSDPCDVTRKHDDFSRVVETSYLSLQRGDCPCPDPPYHRTRVLLGIEEPARHDPAGEQGLAARRRVAQAPVDERPQALLAEFRRMSVLDSAYMRPAEEAAGATLFPVLPEHAPVVLACLEIEVSRHDGCVEIGCVEINLCCRRALLPTTTIQELLCGLAPGLLDGRGDDPVCDAGGPRVRRESVEWTHGGTRLRFSVTAALNRSTIRDAVRITSLRDHGWYDEDIVDVDCRDDYHVVIELADAPACEIVRLIVKGTGPWPVMGVDPPVPLAGLVGGPPGTADDGVDVVLTFTAGPGGLEETS